MPMLVVERGADKGLNLKVTNGATCLVGRENPQAALALADPMASRSHFQITSREGVFLVRDMKSRNGTLLNDEPLAPETDVELKIGDKIQVGETIFSFLSDEKEEAAGGLIGKVIGGYRLLERVGRGGMGTVYKAEQISLNRVVALKVLSSKLLSDPVFVERFVQEARAAGGLNHPNIVQVFDVGSDRGVNYFSMEFMDHGSVGDIVQKEGAVPWERALEMLTDAARGLIFAEKRGVVHRDIKPDNLMLTGEGTVKIGDLGLAKKTEDLAGEGGQIFGTPHFIAPEQAQGKSIDHRADIYALGASFYRVLSGKTPFSGENVKEILLKQIREEPVPLKKLVPKLPEEMAAVVGKMMMKKPDDRYRSAQGLFEDLERIRVRYHLEAHGHTASARRNKVIAAVLAVAVLGIGAYAYHLATKPKEVEYIDRPGQNNNNNSNANTPPPPPPPPDPAKLAAEALTPVLLAEANLKIRLQGGPAETWKENEAEWEALAARYAAVGKEHGGTPKGDEAAEKARSIREEIRKAKEADRLRGEKFAADFRQALEDARTAAAAGHPAKAVAELQSRAAALLEAGRAWLPRDAAKAARDAAAGICAAAETRVNPLLERALKSASVFPGTEYLAARKELEGLRDGIAPATAAADDEFALRFKALSERVGETLRTTRRTAREAAVAAEAADREAFFRGYLRIRRWSPLPQDEHDPAHDTPFYEFRWDAALSQWKSLLAVLKTEPYRERVRAKILQYERCRRLFETVAAKVRENQIKDPDFPDSVRRGVGVILDSMEREKATPEGVGVIRTSNRQKFTVEFREMTPREFYELFLKKGEGIPFSPEDRIDLAVFLAEAGAGELAYGELTTAINASPPVRIDPDLRKWLEQECTLAFEYSGQGGILEAIHSYRRARESGLKAADVERIRAGVEAKIREFLGAERFYRSDLFLLHHSMAGADGPVPERLFPSSVTESLVRTLGTGQDVPGTPDPGTPDEGTPPGPKEGGETPPPPANGGGETPAPGEPTEKNP